MRVAFLGCSKFSSIVLDRLLKSHHKVVCVVSSLDKKVGRGGKVEFSDIKKYALAQKLPILQFKSVSKEGAELIKSYQPDVLVTASFGQILNKNILELAKYGCINVHASLLPLYRGSAPINWAIINGEKQTGITIMQTVLKLDAGDMLLKESLPIFDNETAGELLIRLARLGGECLINALNQLEEGSAKFEKQKEELSSYYPKLDKNMSYIDFEKTGNQIKNFVRGLSPWPLARVSYKGQPLIVYEAQPYDNIENIDLSQFENGEVVWASGKKGLVVKCKDGLCLLKVIQAPNSKKMESKAYLNGKKIEIKTNLSKIF